jgi:tetratricopeptide (TPR) repeat protein
MKPLLTPIIALSLYAAQNPALESARERQDRGELAKLAAEYAASAEKQPKDAPGYYRAAVAWSYLSEVASEQRDRAQAKGAAESGIKMGEKAVALDGRNAENHRVLGTLCGQVISANVLAGLKWGKCAQEEINKAVELDPKSPLAQLGRGVGNYYLPAQLGGSIEQAIKDFDKAIALDGQLAEAHLWRGIALRKANRNAEARKAFERSLQLNPKRVWAKQQLEKTPAQ